MTAKGPVPDPPAGWPYQVTHGALCDKCGLPRSPLLVHRVLGPDMRTEVKRAWCAPCVADEAGRLICGPDSRTHPAAGVATGGCFWCPRHGVPIWRVMDEQRASVWLCADCRRTADGAPQDPSEWADGAWADIVAKAPAPVWADDAAMTRRGRAATGAR